MRDGSKLGMTGGLVVLFGIRPARQHAGDAVSLHNSSVTAYNGRLV